MSNQSKDQDKKQVKIQIKTKNSINMKTSLSNQGYSIYKNKISETELKAIKDDLTIKPFSCPGYGNSEDIDPYKLYKENEDKLYMPNFYGKTKYGNAENIKLNEPDTITLAFSPDRQLRDYQKEIIKTYIKTAKKIGGGIISVGCGRGKCLEKGTILPLYNGDTKKVEELEEGEILIGDDGKPRIILNLGSGISEMFEVKSINNNNIIDIDMINKQTNLYNNKTVTISNFKPYTVNKNHILTLYKENVETDTALFTLHKVNTMNTFNIKLNQHSLFKDNPKLYNKTVNKNNVIDISIEDYLSLPESEKETYYELKLPLKFLCLLFVKNTVKQINYDRNKTINIIHTLLLTFPKNITNINTIYSFYIGYIIGFKLNQINDESYNSVDHISENILFNNLPNSIDDIIDINDKLKTDNIIKFINKIKIDDLIIYFNKHKLNFQCMINLYIGLIISFTSEKISISVPLDLNFINEEDSISNTKKSLRKSINSKSNINNLFNLCVKLLDMICISYNITTFISSSIKILCINKKYNEYYNHGITPIIITSKGLGEYYGFELSGNGRFILSDRTITHNTVMSLKIAEELNVKTLILVHKEFLMNQWVERINEYLPGAKVGYIQGKTFDISRKDIVLAMIQSLSDPRKDKDYPANLFESFGLVIADECHHLAARQFCRSLSKYPFKYTLGLSATPDRADGLQRVFKHYLGDIIYKDSEIQQNEEDIRLEHIPNSTVEVYIYNNPDYKYSKEELNYKKKANIVTMKSNVANCLKRTQFLLSFLPRLIQEGRTMLILSCRRNHISEMEILINEMNIPNCTVGLYVGGMKQSNLDISATKRVIIATYNMAEEAFDCKTLNTLIYATPHKHIKQAVGRILREEKKKRTFIPLIIDLHDIFSTFNTWNKLRDKYYKTEQYPIKIFNVIDKPEIKFKPEITFIKDISNKKTSHNKNSKKKNIAFVIDTNNDDNESGSEIEIDSEDKCESDESDDTKLVILDF